jgi:hypothetical protein
MRRRGKSLARARPVCGLRWAIASVATGKIDCSEPLRARSYWVAGDPCSPLSVRNATEWFDDGFDEAGLDVVDEARYDDRLVRAMVLAERGDVHDGCDVGVVDRLRLQPRFVDAGQTRSGGRASR